MPTLILVTCLQRSRLKTTWGEPMIETHPQLDPIPLEHVTLEEDALPKGEFMYIIVILQ